MLPPPATKLAFSLVELSIVLVILGLLVGAILAGQSLIKAAELRTIPRDFQKYHAAVVSFRDKYLALPGDMPNATAFWGAADGDDGTDAIGAICSGVTNGTTATCNGDGDGFVGGPTGGQECFISWKHLANAGLIEGSYTGVAGPGSILASAHTPGINVPSGRIAKSAFLIGRCVLTFGGFNFSGTFIPNNIAFVSPTPEPVVTGPRTYFRGALSHEDALGIDIKMDDGLASSGKIRADLTRGNTNTAVTDMTCYAYDATNTSNTCAIGYIWGN
jgi:prepilin-type N-terminal cleavage/methylation domain-containing protein